MRFSKFVAAAAVAFSALGANAQVFPDFTVDPTIFPGPLVLAPFEADKMTGPYVERFTTLTVNPDGTGTFESSAHFTIQGFSRNEALTPVPAGTSGLGINYNLYGTFTATGSISGIGTDEITFTGTTGSLRLFSDDNVDTVLGFDGANQAVVVAGGADDNLLASTDTVADGAGHIFPDSEALGDFALVFTDLVLTPLGEDFFIEPVPFYIVARASGQLDTFDVAEGVTAELTGSVDVRFVPEPSALALAGIALVGAGFAGRRARRT